MSRKAGLLRPIFPKYPYANNFSDRPARRLQIDPHPGALFVGLQDHEPAEMIRLIREADIDLMIVGCKGAMEIMPRYMLEQFPSLLHNGIPFLFPIVRDDTLKTSCLWDS